MNRVCLNRTRVIRVFRWRTYCQQNDNTLDRDVVNINNLLSTIQKQQDEILQIQKELRESTRIDKKERQVDNFFIIVACALIIMIHFILNDMKSDAKTANARLESKINKINK